MIFLKNIGNTAIKTTLTAFICVVAGFICTIKAQSLSKGNTYVHGPKEMVVFKNHNFSVGGNGLMPGIVGTKRNNPTYLAFSGNAIAQNPSDKAHVDGYVRNYSNREFTFPVGDNGVYGPITMVPVDTIPFVGPITAAYFRANPDIAITTSLKGTNEAPLPIGAPFSRSSKISEITNVSATEYWDIDGNTPLNIRLHWNPSSQIEFLTSGMLMGLRVVGWDGTKWIDVPAVIDPESDFNQGSITTTSTVIPNDCKAFTFGVSCMLMDVAFNGIPPNIYVCEGQKYSIDVDVLLGGLPYTPEFYLERWDGSNWVDVSGPNNDGVFVFDGLPLNSLPVRYRIRGGIGGCARHSQEFAVHPYKFESLSCISNINASVNKDCEILVTPSMILASAPSNLGFFDVVVMNSSGDIVPNPIKYLGVNQTYMIKIVDRCSGNSCWSTLNVEDKLAPIVKNKYADQSFACHLFESVKNETASDHYDNMSPFVVSKAPLVVENCSHFNALFVDTESDLGCGAKQIVRKWTFTDNAGNKTSSEQVLTFNTQSLNDVMPPVQMVYLDCADQYSPLDLQAKFDDIASQDDTDSKYIVENNEGAMYAGFTYLAKGADGNNHAQLVGENLCNLHTSYTDEVVSQDMTGGCFIEKIILRKWAVLDVCTDEYKIFEQFIKLKDTIGPNFSVEPIFAALNGTECITNVNVTAPFNISDNCSALTHIKWHVKAPAGAIVSGSQPDYIIQGLSKGLHTLTYIVEDCAGNKTAKNTTIHVQDLGKPVAIANQNIVVGLSSSSNGIGYAKLFAKDINDGSFDNCGDVRVEIRRKANVICENDGLNNHNNNFTFSNQTTVIQQGNTWSHADNSRLDTDNGAFVTFCCEDLTSSNVFGMHEVEMRVWDDANGNGIAGDTFVINQIRDNFNVVWVNVKVEHKLAPELTCPTNVEVVCNDEFNLNTTAFQDADISIVTGLPTVKSICQNEYDLSYLDKWINGGECNTGTIQRTFKINNSSISCVQLIKVNAHPTLFNVQFDPQEVAWNDCAFSMEDALKAVQQPLVTHSPCAIISSHIEIDTFTNVGNTCKKWLVTYAYHNECTNETIKAPAIAYYYNDTIAPEIQLAHTVINQSAQCNSDVIISATLTDKTICSGDAMLRSETLIDIDGNDTIDYVSSYLFNGLSIDTSWGKSSVGQSSYSTITNLYPQYKFGQEVNFISNKPTKANNGITSLAPVSVVNNGVTNKVIWIVRDDCGNSSSETYEFKIEDTKAPELTCIGLSTKLVSDASPSIELWAKDFISKVTDNCDAAQDLIVAFDNVSPIDSLLAKEHYFKNGLNNQVALSNASEYQTGLSQKWDPVTQSSVKVFRQTGLTKVSIHVWDSQGNTVSCTTDLNIINSDRLYPITGRVVTIDDKPKKGVAVMIDNSLPGFPKTTVTDTNGYFVFEVPLHTPYTLSCAYNGNYLEEVSTLDLVLIQRHVLSLKKHDHIYKMIASDANNDSKITAIDLVELRKLILGTIPALGNKSWRIPVKNQVLDLESPFPYAESYVVDPLVNLSTKPEFVAIKIGDINGSLPGINGGKIKNRTGNKLSFVADNMVMNANEKVYVPIYASNFRNISGFQTSIQLKNAIISEIIPEALDITENNFGKIRDNLMTLSIGMPHPLSLDNNTKLFTLVIEAKAVSLLEDILSFGSSLTKAEYYNADLEVGEIDVRFRNDNRRFVFLQSGPNPFTASSTIHWMTSQEENITFTITDEKGSNIMTKDIKSLKGMNSLTINGSDLPIPGVYFYTFTGQDFNETSKFVKVE